MIRMIICSTSLVCVRARARQQAHSNVKNHVHLDISYGWLASYLKIIIKWFKPFHFFYPFGIIILCFRPPLPVFIRFICFSFFFTFERFSLGCLWSVIVVFSVLMILITIIFHRQFNEINNDNKWSLRSGVIRFFQWFPIYYFVLFFLETNFLLCCFCL